MSPASGRATTRAARPVPRHEVSRVAVAPATRRPVAYLLAVALAVVGFLTAVPAGPADASTAQLHTLLAQTRSSHRLPALQRSSSLDAVAQRWSQQMASSGKLAHNPKMTSQIPTGWTFAGENVGYAGSAAQVHDAWLKSPGHRANILDRDYNAVGIGYVKVGTRIWATQVFARYQRVPNPVSTTTSTSGSTSTGAVAVQSGVTAAGLRVSDLSGDKRADVVARDSKGQLWVYPGSGRGSLAARKLAGRGWGSYTVTTPGDMNGDGRGDIYARDSSGRLWLYPGNGRSGLSARRLVGTGWNGYTLVTPGDFNGDGRNDLLARDRSGKLWLYPGNGKGGFSARKQIGSGWQIMGQIT